MNMGIYNHQTGSGPQNNNNAGSTQNLSFVNSFNTSTSHPLKSLWQAIAGVGASHNAEQQYVRGECLPGTREEVLRIIWEWILSQGKELPICWLSGTAGVGKTAIAMTIAKAVEREGRLVSSLFFFRSDPKRNNPSALVLSIAHGLGVTNPSCRVSIEQRISDNPMILEARIEEQFRELVVKPYEHQALPPPQKSTLRQTPSPRQTPFPHQTKSHASQMLPPPQKPSLHQTSSLRPTKPHGSQMLCPPQKLSPRQTPSPRQTKPHGSQMVPPPQKPSLRQNSSLRQTKSCSSQMLPLPQKILGTSSRQKKPEYTQKSVGEHSLAEMEVPNLVIIDGLDECGDEQTQTRVLSMIQSAFRGSSRSPLRFLIFSRPEAWLQEAFADDPLSKLSKIILLNDDFKPAKDIMQYYRHQFGEIVRRPKYRQVQFPTPWPTEEDLKTLVDKSCSQFVYAATVSRFIAHADNDPMDQLHLILGSTSNSKPGTSPYQELDRLYNIILTANRNPDKVRPVLAAIVVLSELEYTPLTPALIKLVLGLPSGQVALRLRGMHSVLNIGGRDDAITVHHTSFREYLLDQNRSRNFHIDIDTQKYAIAQQWLQNLTTSKVLTYSPSQLYSDGTKAFFYEWIQLCTSTPKPSRDLLDHLWNVNVASVCLWGSNWGEALEKLVQWLRKYDGPGICESKDKKETAENYSKVGENTLLEANSHSSCDNGQCQVEVHRMVKDEEGLDLVQRLVHKFQSRPGCFHLVCSPGVTLRRNVVNYLVIFATGCPYRLDQVESEPTDVDNVRLTDCHCDLSGGRESSNPGHLAYQEACRQLVKAYISLFEELAQRGAEGSKANDYLGCCFVNMVASSLLRHCHLDQELLLLCWMFFGLAKGCLMMQSRYVELEGLRKARKNMLGWIETFPDSFGEEGKALKVQICALPWKRWAQNMGKSWEDLDDLDDPLEL
ncbi:hypothetical protein PM082_024543 [Marasmius tenuissimus]|nr:hypothetical protein PM082_024543 [Marasmius tenuissimus]